MRQGKLYVFYYLFEKYFCRMNTEMHKANIYVRGEN